MSNTTLQFDYLLEEEVAHKGEGRFVVIADIVKPKAKKNEVVSKAFKSKARAEELAKSKQDEIDASIDEYKWAKNFRVVDATKVPESSIQIASDEQERG